MFQTLSLYFPIFSSYGETGECVADPGPLYPELSYCASAIFDCESVLGTYPFQI